MIYADFHNADEAGRVRLNTHGTSRDLREQGLDLHDGLELLLSDGELQVHGIVRFSDTERMWVAEVSWSDLKEL